MNKEQLGIISAIPLRGIFSPRLICLWHDSCNSKTPMQHIVRIRGLLALGASILALAGLIRIPYLATFPPAGANAWLVRLPTAGISLISILLTILLIKKLTKNSSLGLWTGFVLSLTPWHIEQSRIFSPAMWELTTLLAGILIYMYTKNKFVRMAVLLTTVTTFCLVNREYWVIAQKLVLPPIYTWLSNLFKLVSGEFLFFKNDTFWWGGLRTQGIFLPFTIGLFLWGSAVLTTKLNRKYIWWMVGFMFLWIIAAANPRFPEGREFFLAVPYLALIVAVGLKHYWKLLCHGKNWQKILLGLYALIVIYEYLLFFHTYTVHYTNRIKNEIPYAERHF